MTEKDVRQKVQDAVVKAIHAGEDVGKAIKNVTKEIISTSKDEQLETKEKVQKLSKEALEGAKQGFAKARPSAEDFAKKASKTIADSFKEYTPKVGNFLKDVYEGVRDGAKEAINEKKDCDCKDDDCNC
jgi:DNA-directed RNA polymerase